MVKACGGPAEIAQMSTTRCRACGAAARTGAPWCLLCHRDLRAVPEPTPEPVLLATIAAPVVSRPRHASPAPGWPCTVCGADNALDAPACAGCGSGFLAALRHTTEPSLTLPGVGDVSRLSRAARLGLAVLLGLLVALLLIGLVLIAGKLR